MLPGKACVSNTQRRLGESHRDVHPTFAGTGYSAALHAGKDHHHSVWQAVGDSVSFPVSLMLSSCANMWHNSVPSDRLHESHFRRHSSSNNFILFMHLTPQLPMEQKMYDMMDINRHFADAFQRHIDTFRQATQEMELRGQKRKNRSRTDRSTSAVAQRCSQRRGIAEEDEGILDLPESRKKRTVQRPVTTQRPHNDLVLIEAASKHDLLNRSTDTSQNRRRQQKAQEPGNVSDFSRVWRRTNNNDQSCHDDMTKGGNQGTWQDRRQWKHCNKDSGRNCKTQTRSHY